MPVRDRHIIVRAACAKDFNQNEKVCKIINDAFGSDESWTTDRHCVSGSRLTLEEFTKMIEKNGDPDTFLYALEGDEVIGTVQVLPKEGTTTALMALLAVSPAYQSQGIGTLLMREGIRYVKENMKEMTEVFIYVLDCRPELLVWYKRLGFQDNDELIPFPIKSRLLIDDAQLKILRYPLI